MSAAYWAYAAVLVGAAATYVWRFAGVVLAGRLHPNSRWVRWVAYVAYALLAALVARMTLLPVGSLAETPLWARSVAAAAAIGLYFGLGRSLMLPVLGGAAVLGLLVGIERWI